MGFFHTIFLSDGFRFVRALPLWKHPPGVWAIIKSRLCREAAKVGGGQGPLFENSSCRELKNRTVLHFRAKAAALRGAETIQHLGEICTAQCSRGKSKQDRQQEKARKGFSNRRFERRFWVLLPPRAKVPRAGARNVPFSLMLRRCRGISLPPALRATSLTEGGFGVPRLRARRGDVGIAPYETSNEGAAGQRLSLRRFAPPPSQREAWDPAPAGAAGRCGHRPLRNFYDTLSVTGKGALGRPSAPFCGFFTYSSGVFGGK